MKSVYENAYPEVSAGGFTRVDGTLQFYVRVNALLKPDMHVLDFGAGRGRVASSGKPMHAQLCDLRGKVTRVTGIDVDEAVYENPMLHEAIVFDGGRIPLPEHSVDLVLSDHVFEHIPDPAHTASELDRVLKPGGWICARTPHSLSMVAIAGRLAPNRFHARLLRKVQPNQREDRDVFPTLYRLNTKAALRRYFPSPKWHSSSYTWNPEPTYNFGSPLVLRAMMLYQFLKSPICGEVLLVFIQKQQ